MNCDAPASIRQAISREDYRLALQLWDSYAAELTDVVLRGGLTRDELGRAGELLAWSTTVLGGARSHLQARLNMTHSAAAYLQSPEPPGFIRTNL